MCGIVGIVNKKSAPVAKDVLEHMTDVIVHRGPDAMGFWVNGHVGFGHCRLSIIDLESGKESNRRMNTLLL